MIIIAIKTSKKAILVGSNDDSLIELASLTNTAGFKVTRKVFHRKDKLNASFYIGRGKIREIKERIIYDEADIVIFDNELTPAQSKNLEDKFNLKVIDRTQLILDIFACHAHTRESKVQVELAQLQYLLPKLSGRGNSLSKLGGGIGTRGPGETRLEIDRRRIQKRIHKLKSELKDIKKSQELRRKNRTDPLIALVGYTNAGKSTLMNLLTGAETTVANKLFATLDSKLKQSILPSGRNVIFADTVGFIRKLPHQLIASFRTTLGELKNADILLHVVDASQNNIAQQIKLVNSEINKITHENKNKILVFNKIDKLGIDKRFELELKYPDSILVSSRKGCGQEDIIEKITDVLNEDMKNINLSLSYNQVNWLNKIHQKGNVIKEEYLNDKIKIKANVTKVMAKRINKILK